METEPLNPIEDAASRLVPEDLMQGMHKANQQLHEARRALEAAMDDSQYRHQERVDHAGEELLAAEKAVEDINLQVHKTLKPPPLAP